MGRRIISGTAAALAIVLVCGCDSGGSSSVQTLQSSVSDEPKISYELSASVSEFVTDEITAEHDEAESIEAIQTASVVSTDAEKITEEIQPEQSFSAEKEQTVQASAEPPEEVVTQEAPIIDDIPAVTVTVTTAQTTAASVSTSASTAAAAVPEEVSPVVIIPDVKTPLSPGDMTIIGEKAVVDYSNSSEGYISVCWSGTGKSVKLRMLFGDAVYQHDIAGGGVTEYFPISCGSGEYTIQIYEQIDGNRYSLALEDTISVSLKKDTLPFLYPNKYVDFSKTSDCVRKAAELCAGKNGDIEKLAAIFQWITDNVTYDRQLAATVQSGYTPNPDRTLANRTGICYDYASLMAAMIRSQGIPARLVVGYAADNIYHAWNEVYTAETGWITPELLLSRKGYNITDATFYAGSSDKEKIAEYISDSGNYAALYYY